MSERKYTDEEVVKALECCINADCLNCPQWSEEWYSGMCNGFLKGALDLINRQKAEIEKLQEVNADLNESLRLAAEANKDLKAEIERLTKERDAMRSTAYLLKKHYEWAVKAQETSVKAFSEFIHAVRSDAINEFAERLHKGIDDFRDKREMVMLPYTESALLIIERKIDNLVAEMTEGK